MKNTIKTLGIIAIAAIIAFALIACEQEIPTNLGETATLSGKVYTYTQNPQTYAITWTAYSGAALTVTADGMSGNGTISATGDFSFTLRMPTSLYDFTKEFLEDELFEPWSNLTVAPANAKGSMLFYFGVNSPDYYGLYRGNVTLTSGPPNLSGTEESVMYVYVDKDVTISGKETTESSEYDGETFIYTSKDFHLTLKQGWNPVYHKGSSSWSGTTVTNILEIKLGNPDSLRWVLEED
jgi:hypothetical protein